MITKEEAYQKIAALTEKFADQLPNYKRSDYNEALTRIDFINPFFEALGWDINNRQGAWEAYREVIYEDKLKIGGVTTAPDYSFRLTGGQRLFFVEAKKPSIVIKDDVGPAYQVRLYGWNAKLAISVVTDFEEFAIYDCSKKPLKTDKANKARLNYFTYKDYLANFDFFWNTFSKEQVVKGGLIKFQQSDKKGTTTVDKDFLASLDEWRKELAGNIFKNNRDITEEDLNYTVQQIIDRIIFLRIAEDRGLEPYAQLKSSLKEADHYKELYRQFRVADDKYNSGLFHFKKEKENTEAPDSISGSLSIDNKVIKSIINSLYPPLSEYLFSVLPVEILGSAYEQFLGKQIIIKGAKATIEDKPEVRKAGGVYYTPQYIVNYIVAQTLGTLCEGKTAKEVSKLKVVDPACGSGSFLLGAYQYLLDWHTKEYIKNPVTGKNKEAVLTPEGTLTTAEKKRILINNIYGVDIDRNAVEVTKLSLLLKCMEGETGASIHTQMTFFNERVLPSLEKNIKSGNSLVDLDYYESEMDFGEEKKVKPFSWKQQFADVFKNGGFDVVIGNPPYVFGRDWKSLGISDEIKHYLGNKYRSSPYQLDMFSIFMEQGIELTKRGRYTSFIVPNVWLTNTYSETTRKFILKNAQSLSLIVPLKKVFEGITVDTIIYVLEKGEEQHSNIKLFKISKEEVTVLGELLYQEYESGKKPISASIPKSLSDILDKIQKETITLGSLAEITRGVHPYRLGGYGKSFFTEGSQVEKDIEERPYHSKIAEKAYRPFIYGKDLKALTPVIANDYINYGKWLAEPRDPKFFEGDRIYSRKILGRRLVVTVEQGNSVTDQQVYITKPIDNNFNVFYLAGILNSNLISFFIRNYFDEVNDAFPQIKVSQLKSLPIKPFNTELKIAINNISTLVELTISLNKQKHTTTFSEKIEQLNQRIAYTDEKINKLVYELYELSEEEVKIIENV